MSENPNLAKACAEHGIVFIGPSAEAIEAMASKQLSKKRLEEHGIPMTPGYHGADQSNETLLKQARLIKFPVLIKAARGGGGKGMRIVHQEKEFLEALSSARREAEASFKDDTLILEQYIAEPRHIEVQIMADHHGNIVHLYDRDCSIQRRHQKIIEEAPAPHLSDELRDKIAQSAIQVARAIQYCNAGTVEFLLHGDRFYFMEMNTRLQVEHPVTELITNLDLVEWQIKIAQGEHLPLTQEQLKKPQGHAIECRIYAEDPEHQFLPSTGIIDFLREPEGEHIRIDTGIQLVLKLAFIMIPWLPNYVLLVLLAKKLFFL